MKQKIFARILMLGIILGTLALGSGVYAGSFPGPGKNIMNCSRTNVSGLEDGKLACYGIWDQGNEFGGDINMCPDNENGDGIFEPKTGCVIKTKICKSGIATATAYHTPNQIGDDHKVDTIIKNLGADANAVTTHVLRLWEYTCGKNVTPAEDLGTYKGYLDDKLFITTENATKSYALENCKLNSKNNPKSAIYCTWKGEEVYRFTPKPIEETGIFSMFIDGSLISTGMDMTKETALSQCKNKASSYPNSEIKCSWNNAQIYYVPKPETKATLYVYVNGSSNLTKEKLTRETAFTECKSRALQYTNSEVKCTWNGEEIYYVKKIDTYAKLIMEVDGKIIYTQENITRDAALAQCKEKVYSYTNSEFKCSWNSSQIYYIRGKEAIYKLYVNDERLDGKSGLNLREAREACSQAQEKYSRSEVICYWDDDIIFSSEEDRDEEPEYCGYGYEYFSDIDRCVKSSYMSYYSLMKREFGTTISRLTVSKLKLVIERIEDMEYKYSENSTTRLKLEALKLVIETEIRDQQGDDFDFEDLFN